jgi:hypothetical protein
MLKYTCSKCGFEYLKESLKSECERTPVVRFVRPIGSVLKIDDFVFGIVYGESIQHQTHIGLYDVATTGIDLEKCGIWSLVPEVKIEASILNAGQPVTDDDFAKVQEALAYAMKKVPDSDVPHLVKLRELQLVPYLVE